MVQLTAHSRILIATEPVDFRKGIDGLAAACRQLLKVDPFSGSLFVFCNRRRTAIKILVYDGQGFWLCMKRLSNGRFRWWPRPGEPVSAFRASQLQILLWNGNPDGAQIPGDWRKVA